RVTAIAYGPLHGNRILDTGPGDPVHLLNRDGNPVDNTTVTPLASGDHLVVRGDTTYLVADDGLFTYRVTYLTGRNPDLLALTRPDGQLYPLPRTLDGTTLHDHVIRHTDATPTPTRANPNPPQGHRLTLHTPERAITYHADTGRVIENSDGTDGTDGTPGFQRVNDVEYLLLTPEHRAIPVQQLTESTTSTRPTTPDLGDTDLTVHMAFVPDRPGNPGSDASDGSGVPGPARHGMGDSNVELTELPHPVRLSGHDGRSTGTLTTPPGGGAPTLTRDGQPVATDDIRITDRAILIRTGTTTTFHDPHDGHFLANLHVHRDGPLADHIAITRAGQPPLLIRLDGQPTDLHVHHTGPLTGHIAITRAGQ
ncbi:hypothetical protein, partial [Streptomyces radicis]